MNFREAIGLGVVCDDIPLSGDITTKAKYEKRKARHAHGERRSRGRCHIFAGLRTAWLCCCFRR